MSLNDLPIPRMDWEHHDLSSTFALFKQKCSLYFSVKGIANVKQVDYILLFAGEQGIKLYNSWDIQAEEKTTENVWKRFETHIEPKTNFRVARIYFREYKQNADETIDDFIARCRLQSSKCCFSDAEKEDRILDQVIAGIKHQELKKELLSKDATYTLSQALDLGRTYEASIRHMKSVAQAKTSDQVTINAFKNESYQKCQNCGRRHAKQPRNACPAYGTICNACQKRNHWQVMCRTVQNAEQKSDTNQHKQQQPRTAL